MPSYFGFRYRRAARSIRRLSRTWRKRTSTYVNRHLWGKWHQFHLVRRFLIVWVAVIIVGLIGLGRQLGVLNLANSTAVAVAGGTYTQATVGEVKVLNPVLPENSAASDINELVFSGLTRYDAKRRLQPDLAESWTVSPDGKVYTFKLRHGVKWHDDVPFTSADVAFTITAIQNPDSRSPLASSWQGVKVAAPNDFTVTFTLPTPLNSFMDATTLGLIPLHLLGQVDPSSLREADFNRHPVGTGPFKLSTFAPSAGEVELSANAQYYLGKPKLDGFSFRFYDSTADALTAYAQHQVTSPGRLNVSDEDQASRLQHLAQLNMSLPTQTTLFFNTASGVLKDATLRQTLSLAIDRRELVKRALAGQGLAITQPLLPGQLGYTAKYAKPALSQAAAQAALTAAGWQPGTGGVRHKGSDSLAFTLVTADNHDLIAAANEVARQLEPIGVKITVKPVELDELEQTYMRPRNFSLLLFGVNLGADPDVYAFWHSSQAKDPGVNLSGYTAAAADSALESARIKSDDSVRVAKYDAFLKAWNSDNPAAVLYQPEYVYGVADSVMGISAQALVVPSDRFYDVQNWTVRQRLGRP